MSPACAERVRERPRKVASTGPLTGASCRPLAAWLRAQGDPSWGEEQESSAGPHVAVRAAPRDFADLLAEALGRQRAPLVARGPVAAGLIVAGRASANRRFSSWSARARTNRP